VLALADTHIGDAPRPALPEIVWDMVREADVVLHAGDILSPAFLDRLEAAATTYAVLGNNDRALVGRLPETRELELGGVHVALVHDAGPKLGRERRLRRRFPDAQLVVFGHSHIPLDTEGIDGQWLFNPGSPTTRRREPHPTVGLIELGGGRITHHQIRVV
jgi:putative phosphoesterase